LNLHRSLPALAVLAALACFGQTTPAAKPAPVAKKSTVPVKTHGSANRVGPSDAQIEKDIRERFAASKIAADKFEVHVQGGRATITGNTDVLQHKGTATRMAHSAGATDVVNKVEPSEAAREKAVANLTKGRRRAQVKRAETEARSEQH
jgi:BON domain